MEIWLSATAAENEATKPQQQMRRRKQSRKHQSKSIHEEAPNKSRLEIGTLLRVPRLKMISKASQLKCIAYAVTQHSLVQICQPLLALQCVPGNVEKTKAKKKNIITSGSFPFWPIQLHKHRNEESTQLNSTQLRSQLKVDGFQLEKGRGSNIMRAFPYFVSLVATEHEHTTNLPPFLFCCCCSLCKANLT